MRKMFSKKQLEELIALVVESKDWQLDGDVSIGGDLVVTGSINGEENPSVKPLYYHPITLVNTTNMARITCLIFNNDSTEFTLSTFADYMDNLFTEVGSTTRIMISGAYLVSTDVYIASYMGLLPDRSFYLAGCKSSDGSYTATSFANKAAFIGRFETLYDGVNLIN